MMKEFTGYNGTVSRLLFINCIYMYILYSMDIKSSRRVSDWREVSGFNRSRGGRVNIVCFYWLAGRCKRDPCKFLHGSPPPPHSMQLHRESPPAQPKLLTEDHRHSGSKTWRSHSNHSPRKSFISPSGETANGRKSTPKTREKVVCHYWKLGNCVRGDQCPELHSWFYGNGFSMLATLEGHNKSVTGIALPLGSDKLYSGGKDKSVRVWDCNTGQCVGVVNVEDEVGTLVSEGHWIFVGLQNAVKAWNIEANTEMTLAGPVGKVYAIDVGNEMLFAGSEDGSITAWKSGAETNSLELATSLKGHSWGVVSLIVGANRLYSGSMDHTIRVWDLDTLKCIQTLNGHTDVVMSLLCWDSFLLSCSLDKTIKVWGANGDGKLEVIYTHNVEQGVLALCGIHDAEAQPILLCSCNDNSVRLYELPSFNEKGRIFAKREVQAIQIGPGGLFFTGDATGQLRVWKLSGK